MQPTSNQSFPLGPQQPWDFDPSVYPELANAQAQEDKPFYLVPAGQKDWDAVMAIYNCPGLDIAEIQVISNRSMLISFSAGLEVGEERGGKPVFRPAWVNETGKRKDTRQRVHDALVKKSKPVNGLKHMRVVPMFHGTKQAIVASILSTNLANLATVDEGYFGKAIYFTSYAEYAERVYGKDRTLLFSWIAYFSAYPVHYSDDESMWNCLSSNASNVQMLLAKANAKLYGKSNYGNHDAHYALVKRRSANPADPVYFPVKDGEQEHYDELAVFQPQQILPRYVVKLGPKPLNIKQPGKAKVLLDLKMALKEYQDKNAGPVSMRSSLRKELQKILKQDDNAQLSEEQQWILGQLIGFNQSGKQLFIENLLLYFHRVSPQDNLDERIIVSIKQIYSAKRTIPRLMGAPLPIEQNFTRLMVVDDEYTSDKTDAGAQFKALKNTVSLDQIFTEDSNKHILLIGPGGIGKSTLCQTMAFQWSQGTLWKERFDLLVWVSLRDLLQCAEDNTYEFILKHCMSPSAQSMIEAEELREYIQRNDARTIFILDGYDEIASGLKKGSKQELILNELKSHANWLIASRAHAVGDVNADKVYENIGFSIETIASYVEADFKSKTKAEALLSYLHRHPVLFGIARIPLVLDGICALWKKKNTADYKTLTDLYSDLLLLLAQRMLDKRGVSTAWEYTIQDIEKSKELQPFLHFLEEISWKSFEKKSHIISLQDKEYAEIFARFGTPEETREMVAMIQESGLFPALTSHKGFLNNQYQFLHPTFQEFFAARYLNRLLRVDPLAARVAIHEYKFQSHFLPVFAFTSGLIRHPEQLNFFFEQLQQADDLIGIGVAALQIRCLEECWPANGLKSKDQLVANIRSWCQFLFNSFHGKAGSDYFLEQFALSSQLGQHIVLETIEASFAVSTSTKQKQYILGALKIVGRGLPHLAIPLLISFLGLDKERELILRTLIEVSEFAPNISLAEFGEYLNHNLESQAIFAFGVIGKRAPDLARSYLHSWIKHGDENIARAALVAVTNIGPLSQITFSKIEKIASEKNAESRHLTIFLLSKVAVEEFRYTLPILDQLISDQDQKIAAWAFLRKVAIVEGTHVAIQMIIEPKGSYSRFLEQNVFIFGENNTGIKSAQPLVQELIDLLDPSTRALAVTYLKQCTASKDPMVSCKAIRTLSQMNITVLDLLQVIIAACFHKSQIVQLEGLRALQKIGTTDYLDVFFKACLDPKVAIQSQALHAISVKAANREKRLMDLLMQCCKSNEPSIKIQALELLCKFAKPTDMECVLLAENLLIEGSDPIKKSAVKLLGVIGSLIHVHMLLEHYPLVPPQVKIEILKALATIGKDEDCTPLMLEAVKSNKLSVALTALESLEKLTSRSAKSTIAELNDFIRKVDNPQLMQEALRTIHKLGKLAPDEAIESLVYLSNSPRLSIEAHRAIRDLGVKYLVSYCHQKNEMVTFLAKFLIQGCFALKREGKILFIFDLQNETKVQLDNITDEWLDKLAADHFKIAQITHGTNRIGHFFMSSSRKYLLSSNGAIAPFRTISFALATLDSNVISFDALENCLQAGKSPEKEFDAPYISWVEGAGDMSVRLSSTLVGHVSLMEKLKLLNVKLISIDYQKFNKKFVSEFIIPFDEIKSWLIDTLKMDPEVYEEAMKMNPIFLMNLTR